MDGEEPTLTSPTEPAGARPAAPADNPAIVDLLGALAYSELTAFDHLADDARLAPTLSGRAALAAMAAAEMGHFALLRNEIIARGGDPEAAMRPFVAAVDGFHESTRPGSWLEGLVKAYVGDGLAADFYREVATLLDPRTRQLVLDVLADTGYAEFAVREVRAAITADPVVAGRLALWARRLVGEALTQSQRVIGERDALADMIMAGTGDLAGVGAMLKRITTAHGQRMQALGLSA